jgi:hypothetical protein
MNEKIEINGNDFEWDFTADSSDELAKIGNKLVKASRPTFRNEQWQMSRFLKAMSSSSIFRFPVRVRHTGIKGVPDFQVESDGRRIAIELSMISTQDLECGRALQRRRVKCAMDTTNLLREKSKPRTEDEIIAAAFAPPTWMFGLSAEEQQKIWVEKATTQLNEKTAVLRRKQFEHGDEDWLVLWDRIETDEFEIMPRIEAVKGLLASRWKPDWYSRVFIQQIEFPPFLAIFSKTEFTSIPNDFEMPTHNCAPDFVFSGSPKE